MIKNYEKRILIFHISVGCMITIVLHNAINQGSCILFINKRHAQRDQSNMVYKGAINVEINHILFGANN
jgi:hypothetical protein